MRKGLTTIWALLLVAGLAACNRGGDNASDDARLNAAANMLDNGVYDTSADDATVNQAELPAEEAAPANGAPNAAAPGNSAGNAQ
ncbi:MAG TPA: hypothetical protein VEC11_11880 [Allosphingosinicella sp.]|nr:hypothetical protein [Allosphingosinicella sp.]